MMFAEGHVVDKGKEAAETINPEWKSQSTWRTRGKSRPDMIPEIRLIQGSHDPVSVGYFLTLRKEKKGVGLVWRRTEKPGWPGHVTVTFLIPRKEETTTGQRINIIALFRMIVIFAVQVKPSIYIITSRPCSSSSSSVMKNPLLAPLQHSQRTASSLRNSCC